jgi:hypothetical protein
VITICVEYWMPERIISNELKELWMEVDKMYFEVFPGISLRGLR